MSLAHYQLLAQVGAGPDGVCYRASDSSEAGPVEVRTLAGAVANEARWARLTARLRRAQLLDHPGAVRLRRLGLDRSPPYIVLDWVEGPTLAEDVGGQRPLESAQALSRALELSDVLLIAHRLGVVHGRLSPEAVRLDGARRPRLDFTDTATPATAGAGTDDPAEDVAGLGRLLGWMLAGRTPDRPLEVLLRDMLATDPAERLTMAQAADRMGILLKGLHDDQALVATNLALGDSPSGTITAPPFLEEDSSRGQQGRGRLAERLAGAPAGEPERLGRFRLLEKLGEGGMGVVYRAEDVSDGRTVAIKVLRPEWAARPDALQRFRKEARLLSEVNNPYVVNLLDFNEDNGVTYLAVEFVAGQSLGERLLEGPLPETEALDIVADVCRGLAAAHERGIVHRDVKPDNILLEAKDGAPLRARLSDFGLARHIEESASLALTRTGAVLGTPLYLAPEQCSGGAVGPPADIYSMGATLFHLLAGRPPFLGDGPMQVLALHCNEPPPELHSINPAVSEGACRLVAKALAKRPEHRHADAGELLRDIERLQRGEPVSLAIHPRLPEADPGKVLRYDFRWELSSTPERLWPYVSNTERLNRAIGLPAVSFHPDPERPGPMRRIARMRKLGLEAVWQEHPFEWVEPRRMGVLREFTQGPFRWLISVVELVPRQGGGTTLTHTFRILPAGVLGRTLAAVEVGIRARQSLARVYHRIDTALTTGSRGPSLLDPFEEPAALSASQRDRLQEGLDRLTQCGIDLTVVERLGDFLAAAAPQDVARIRPLALARRLDLDPEAVVAACLHGAREGLLVLLWDLLCPICRIPSEVQATLRALREHGRCDACNLDYELDFAGSVELIFRAHPAIRDVELGTYCVGGPAHSPHVAAQVRLGPGEHLELALTLAEGAYRLRGPQLPVALDFRTRPEAPLTRWDLELGKGLAWLATQPPRALRADAQVLALSNGSDQELLVRVERTVARDDALTAARASALALFRELFPGEVLSPGQMVSVATLTFLVTELVGVLALYDRMGEVRAFGVIHEHLRALEAHVHGHGGALVKALGEGAVAVFHEPAAAARAALDLPAPAKEAGLSLRAGLHRGPALMATLNDHLDYFGTTVRQAIVLPALVAGGGRVFSQAVMDDPEVAGLLRARGVEGKVFRADLPGQAGAILHRFGPTPAG